MTGPVGEPSTITTAEFLAAAERLSVTWATLLERLEAGGD